MLTISAMESNGVISYSHVFCQSHVDHVDIGWMITSSLPSGDVNRRMGTARSVEHFLHKNITLDCTFFNYLKSDGIQRPLLALAGIHRSCCKPRSPWHLSIVIRYLTAVCVEGAYFNGKSKRWWRTRNRRLHGARPRWPWRFAKLSQALAHALRVNGILLHLDLSRNDVRWPGAEVQLEGWWPCVYHWDESTDESLAMVYRNHWCRWWLLMDNVDHPVISNDGESYYPIPCTLTHCKWIFMGLCGVDHLPNFIWWGR